VSSGQTRELGERDVLDRRYLSIHKEKEENYRGRIGRENCRTSDDINGDDEVQPMSWMKQIDPPVVRPQALICPSCPHLPDCHDAEGSLLQKSIVLDLDVFG